MIIDKNGILNKIKGEELGVTLELGCGESKRVSDAIGVDLLDFPAVDIVGDAMEVLKRFPDDSVQRITSSHFFEHVADLKGLLNECSRVLTRNGKLEIVVPHFSNPYFYSDYTHKTFFGLYTFSYLCHTPQLKRKVPIYGNLVPLRLNDVQLVFRGERPFYVRHAVGSILTKLINLTNYSKEFYEINLCYLMPCHEIKFHFDKF